MGFSYLNILYISYDGLMEPLGESQVLNYLKQVSATHNVHLISFEKHTDILDKQKFKKFKKVCTTYEINWKPLRYSRLIQYVSSLKNISNLFFHAYKILITNKINILSGWKGDPDKVGERNVCND